MSLSPTRPSPPGFACADCAGHLETGAKFCGNCGSAMASARAHQGLSGNLAQAAPTVPNFAPVAPKQIRGGNPALKEERARLMVLLARERLFLYTHWLLFTAINLIGLFIAYRCYIEYLADEMTRLMMATTPLLFINCIALMFIVPINGTRKEIARLKERLKYIRFQIEYNHLI